MVGCGPTVLAVLGSFGGASAQFTPTGHDPQPARIAQRPVWFNAGSAMSTDVFWRERLRPGMMVRGPAIVEEATSVTLIPPGRTATVAADLGLFVKLNERS